MKLIPKNEIVYIPPVVLYWDDVENIKNIIERNELKITHITSGEYEYHTLQELREAMKDANVDNLHIMAVDSVYKKHISINIEKAEVSLSTGDESIGMCLEIRELLRCRSPWWNYTSHKSYWGMLCGAIPIVMSVAVGGCAVLIFKNYTEAIILAVVVFFLTSYIFFKGSPIIGGSKISPKLRVEKKSFWQTNRDQLIVQLIVLMLGLIIGWFFKGVFDYSK